MPQSPPAAHHYHYKALAAQIVQGRRKSKGMQLSPPGYCLLCMQHDKSILLWCILVLLSISHGE